ncbi:MAG: hypothetical protein HON47_02405 [Candidatus Diapherotrites archaeon]|jgi:hypothetical protein|uniref:Uncharacterized protein n=1 Tax=Candidatus Iainarchaeum sp. TaxID=3101447 RepID=A0A8T5GEM6_9ARCH|nr:hypothetical protein [Candidatus Diapherotrites archaeon]
MSILDEKVNKTILDIENLHALVSKTKWNELNREGFVFELERATKRLGEIYSELRDMNKEMTLMLEKNTPNISDVLSEMQREIIILESNIKMEKSKKLREELVNESEKVEVPELYSSLQQKIMKLTLKARYSAEKIKGFLTAKKVPFVQKGSTARNLLELLQKKEDEINELKTKHYELKKEGFFKADKKSIAEIEHDLFEGDKKLAIVLEDAKKALKTHFAQLEYVEGSFTNLKRKVETIESTHEKFTTNAIGLIKELKKDRDFARTSALEIEQDNMKNRGELTSKMLMIEKEKNELKDKAKAKYLQDMEKIKKELTQKDNIISNMVKLVEEQEREISNLKKKASAKDRDELIKSQQSGPIKIE